MREVRLLPVTEPSQAGEARRIASGLAERLGFDETGVGRVALVVTEIAGNLAKHTPQGGELLLRALENGSVGGLEILALDRAPGITNVAQALRDGYSTAGSPGTGLGAVSRSSQLLDIHSLPGAGTAILVHLWAEPAKQIGSGSALERGAVCVPKAGEPVSGDGWAVTHERERTSFLVVDGLGHGIQAAEAAGEAVRVFKASPETAPAARLDAIHAGLRGTRGAAVAIAEVDTDRCMIRYVGVGNISGVVASDEGTRSMISHNGIVGHDARKIQEFTYPWPEGALLIMHSDGLTSRWDLAAYPGLSRRHPALIAGVLYRDFTRGRDDVTVLVAREDRKLAPHLSQNPVVTE